MSAEDRSRQDGATLDQPVRASDVEAQPMPPLEGPGYVYAIVAAECGRVKIGCASSTRGAERPGQIITACPFPAVLHSVTYHRLHRTAEKDAHRLLAHAHRHNEWYDLNDPAVQAWLDERTQLLDYYDEFADAMEALAAGEVQR